MKKLLFALPMLALAIFFTYCDRPNLQEELNSVNQNVIANDRACLVQIDKASPTLVTLCGTGAAATSCNLCGTKGSGPDAIPAGVSPWFTTVNGPMQFSASSVTGNTITVTTSANSKVFVIPAGGCVVITIDASCVVS
ncbi:MAG: hypothetical protein H7246_13180 [Phycisphaerae bacterium]|nr:hypothetical protein [Saprospiraceae bacterium]